MSSAEKSKAHVSVDVASGTVHCRRPPPPRLVTARDLAGLFHGEERFRAGRQGLRPFRARGSFWSVMSYVKAAKGGAADSSDERIDRMVAKVKSLRQAPVPGSQATVRASEDALSELSQNRARPFALRSPVSGAK